MIQNIFEVAFQFRTTIRNGIVMIITDNSTGDSFFIELYDSQVSFFFVGFIKGGKLLIGFQFKVKGNPVCGRRAWQLLDRFQHGCIEQSHLDRRASQDCQQQNDHDSKEWVLHQEASMSV